MEIPQGQQLTKEQEILMELKKQADTYQELLDKKEHHSINNEELVNWYSLTITLKKVWELI